jgi:hypothetical protein
MFKKIKAMWHAIVAVVIVSLIIVFFSVIVPIFFVLSAIAIVGLAGYITYQANKNS